LHGFNLKNKNNKNWGESPEMCFKCHYKIKLYALANAEHALPVNNLYCSTELVGKYPSEIEAETFDISSDIPVFMKSQDLSEDYTKYLKNSSGYFKNNYKIDE
jgi:hypothetical protein